MTSTGEAERHHLLNNVLEKASRVAGHLNTAGSAGPQVLTSMETWTHQPNTLPPVCYDMRKMSKCPATCKGVTEYTVYAVCMAQVPAV